MLWVTERVGKRVLRVDPFDGSQYTALELDEVYQSAGQDGLLGLALHPELLEGTGNDYVYLAFNYDADPGPGTSRQTKLRRYTFDPNSETLIEPLDLLTGLPGSNDHNAGRIKIGPDLKLYYAIGDQGNNQFGNKCRPIRAQALPTQEQLDNGNLYAYAGKILRLNLDGSIPQDNARLAGVRSHIYSYGHRNPQGLVFAANGELYSAEHGPKTDDEINLILKGQNYGWPHVVGYRDDRAYAYGNWSAAPNCASLAYSDFEFPATVPVATETSWTERFISPLRTLYTRYSDYNFQDPACEGSYYICWPTVAPGSIDYYDADQGGIPGWNDSLLAVSLKRGSLFRMELLPDRWRLGEPVELLRTTNRYRDMTIDPSGTKFYIITDNSGQTASPTGGATTELQHPGSILEFSLRK